MAGGLKVSMNLSQQLKLRMTPQLQQAIKLLQLSRLELENAVRKELIENPVLEEVQDGVDDDPARQNAQTSDDIQKVEEKKTDDSDPTRQEEFEWENHLDSKSKPMPSTSGVSDEIMHYENVISTTKTLHEHLHWQAGLAGFNEEELLLATILISYVEDDGWIKTPVEEIAREEDVDAKELEEMFPFIHEFDPPGVGARNLKECLLVQAQHLQEDTKDLVCIIEDHLNELEQRNFKVIAKALNVDLDYIVDLCELILSMEPKPGRMFNNADVHYIMPDVYIHKVSDKYVVVLNEEGLPRLRVSNLYKDILSAKGSKEKDKTTQEYIQEKLRSAIWLIKSIHQRQKTIYKVTESIVKHQIDFFEKGFDYIKPMILKDIANDIEMHESTVSRVTTNKFVHTPRGIFELKYFFNSGIDKLDGNVVASESVKLKIQKMVSQEDAKKPLSDQKIVEVLKKEDISIARRTVAKYRDILKILPSSKRKKYY